MNIEIVLQINYVPTLGTTTKNMDLLSLHGKKSWVGQAGKARNETWCIKNRIGDLVQLSVKLIIIKCTAFVKLFTTQANTHWLKTKLSADVNYKVRWITKIMNKLLTCGTEHKNYEWIVVYLFTHLHSMYTIHST